MILSAILFSTSAIGCAFCIDFNQLVVYRIIGGIGIGVVSIVSPLYISEVSVAQFRGRMVSLYQLAVTVGFLPVIGIFREWKPLTYRLVRKNSSYRSVERYVRHGDITSRNILYYYLFHTRKPQMADSKRTRKESHLYSGKDLQFI